MTDRIFSQENREKIKTGLEMFPEACILNLSSLGTKLNRGVNIMAAKVDAEKCAGCESCVGACPVEAIKMVDGKAVVDEGACVECGACVGECPCEAISI